MSSNPTVLCFHGETSWTQLLDFSGCLLRLGNKHNVYFVQSSCLNTSQFILLLKSWLISLNLSHPVLSHLTTVDPTIFNKSNLNSHISMLPHWNVKKWKKKQKNRIKYVYLLGIKLNRRCSFSIETSLFSHLLLRTMSSLLPGIIF